VRRVSGVSESSPSPSSDPVALPLLDLDDLQRITRIARRTWRRWIARGDIPSHRISRRMLVAADDLRAFLAARRRAGSEGAR
jgi:excisionase family DNA binding protein